MANNIKKVTNVNGGIMNLGQIEIAAIRGVEQGSTIRSTQTVAAGNGSGNSVTLDGNATYHFVTTATNSSHVTVADGALGQVKYIIHKTRSNTTDLVITPTNFAAGSTLTSNLASRSVGLVFDGTNWQVISGEITGTAEMVIG